MKYTQYTNAADFLKRMKKNFERSETVNGLMYGISLQLRKDLFTYGEEQPLFAIVEEDLKIHLAALMTPPHKLQISAPDQFSPQSVKTLVKELQINKWFVPAIIAEKHLARSFAREWTAQQQCKSREGLKQMIYELRTVQTLNYAHGEFRQAKSRNLDTAIAWTRGFHVSCFGNTDPDKSARVAKQKVRNGELFFWVDKEPVSMAARTRPTPNGESIGFVYTPPEHRRRGYATSVIARLSQHILDDGKRFCCLYTDLDNPTSNSIYRKIGYAPVADVLDIHFKY